MQKGIPSAEIDESLGPVPDAEPFQFIQYVSRLLHRHLRAPRPVVTVAAVEIAGVSDMQLQAEGGRGQPVVIHRCAKHGGVPPEEG